MSGICPAVHQVLNGGAGCDAEIGEASDPVISGDYLVVFRAV
jgi:hypothetical protein